MNQHPAEEKFDNYVAGQLDPSELESVHVLMKSQMVYAFHRSADPDVLKVLKEKDVQFIETNRELETNITITKIWSKFTVVSKRRSRIFKKQLKTSEA